MEFTYKVIHFENIWQGWANYDIEIWGKYSAS